MASDASMETLVLPATLDLAAAAPLLAELKARRGRPLALDGAAVRRVGCLCLQVLIAARDAWREDGHRLAIQPSDAFLTAARDLGAAGRLLEPVA